MVALKAKIPDFETLCSVDPHFWAYKKEIKLVDGIFGVAGRAYQIEPMRSDAQRQCNRKGTQGGWSQIHVLRAFHKLKYGYYPKGSLYLMPTDGDVTDFSSSRFKPLINDNPGEIGNYVRDTNRDNLKRVGNGFLYFRGAHLKDIKQAGQKIKSSTRLKGIPVDEVVFDELDEMPAGARGLALRRMEDSDIKREVYLGNPTIPDYGIDRIYEVESDRRIWVIKCGSCGKHTCLETEFPNSLRRTKEGKVFRACIKCGHEIFVKDGKWEVRDPDRTEYMEGYWGSHLIQPNTDLTELLNSYEQLSEQQNVSRATTEFYNLRLGLGYLSAENRLTPNDCYNICSRDAMRINHPGPCAMGVDCRSATVLHVVIGYRPYESGLAACKFARVSSYNDVYDLAKRFHVSSCVMDRKPEIRKAREFQDNADFEVFLCDYNEHQRHNPAFNSETGLVTINRTEVCEATHDLVIIPGRYTIPRRDSEVEEYALEMSNMAKVLVEDEETGDRVYRYVKLGPDDYRHATNYFLLAAMRIGVCEPPKKRDSSRDAWSDGFKDHETEGAEVW